MDISIKKRIKIIPEPKFVFYQPGFCGLDRNLEIIYSCRSSNEQACKSVIDFVVKRLTDLHHKVSVKRKSGHFLKTDNEYVLVIKRQGKEILSPSNGIETVSEEQGYILQVSSNLIVCAAKDNHGLFYSVQSLLQSLKQYKKLSHIPCVNIKDWPELSKRTAQIDLWAGASKLSVIKQQLEQMSEYKINSVMLYYGDKFKFEKHPKISHPDALSKAEIRELVSFAHELHIDMIPFLQCFGHSANVLINPEYAHLKEGDTNQITQLCPQEPGTFELFKDMVNEVMEVHDSNYISIGADETYFLGTCPKCKSIADKKGKIGLYIDYVNKVCDFVRSKDKVPLIADDMLCQSPEKISLLNHDFVITYWDYFPADHDNPFVFFRNEGYYCNKKVWQSRKWWGGDFVNSGRCRDITELAKEKFIPFKKYLSTSKDFLYFERYPFYKFFKDAGFETVGCSAIRAGEYGSICPDHYRRLSNIRGMIEVVWRNKGSWVIATSWSGVGFAPEELCSYLLLAHAEYSWSPSGVSNDDFDKKYVTQMFGVDELQVVRALRLLGKHKVPLQCEDEDRSDVAARDQFADKESYKELVDKRIMKLIKKGDLENSIVEINDTIDDANIVLTLCTHLKKTIRLNKLIIDHIEHGARLLLYKAALALAFIKSENLLNSKTWPKSEIHSAVQELEILLVQTKKLAQSYKQLFAKTHSKLDTQTRSDALFSGEQEKIVEYRKSLLALLGTESY